MVSSFRSTPRAICVTSGDCPLMTPCTARWLTFRNRFSGRCIETGSKTYVAYSLALGLASCQCHTLAVSYTSIRAPQVIGCLHTSKHAALGGSSSCLCRPQLEKMICDPQLTLRAAPRSKAEWAQCRAIGALDPGPVPMSRQADDRVISACSTSSAPFWPLYASRVITKQPAQNKTGQGSRAF